MGKILCIKEYNQDEEYGLDFKVGNVYSIENVDSEGIYVGSENGSSVQLDFDEINTYFVSAL